MIRHISLDERRWQSRATEDYRLEKDRGTERSILDLSTHSVLQQSVVTGRPHDATVIDHLLSGRFARAPDGARASARAFIGSAHEVAGTLDVMHRFDILAQIQARPKRVRLSSSPRGLFEHGGA